MKHKETGYYSVSTDRQTDKPTDQQTDKQTDRPTDRPTDIQTNTQTDQQTNRQTNRPTDQHTNRPTDQPVAFITCPVLGLPSTRFCPTTFSLRIIGLTGGWEKEHPGKIVFRQTLEHNQ